MCLKCKNSLVINITGLSDNPVYWYLVTKLLWLRFKKFDLYSSTVCRQNFKSEKVCSKYFKIILIKPFIQKFSGIITPIKVVLIKRSHNKLDLLLCGFFFYIKRIGLKINFICKSWSIFLLLEFMSCIGGLNYEWYCFYILVNLWRLYLYFSLLFVRYWISFPVNFM